MKLNALFNRLKALVLIGALLALAAVPLFADSGRSGPDAGECVVE